MRALVSRRNSVKVGNKNTIVLLEGYGIQLEMFIDPNHPERSVNPERIGL